MANHYTLTIISDLLRSHSERAMSTEANRFFAIYLQDGHPRQDLFQMVTIAQFVYDKNGEGIGLPL